MLGGSSKPAVGNEVQPVTKPPRRGEISSNRDPSGRDSPAAFCSTPAFFESKLLPACCALRCTTGLAPPASRAGSILEARCEHRPALCWFLAQGPAAPGAGGYGVEPRGRVRTRVRARLPRSAGRPGPRPARPIQPPGACRKARPLPASRRNAQPEGAPRTAARGEGGVRGAGRECGDRRKWGAAGSAGQGQEQEGCTSRGWARSGIPGSTHGVRSAELEAGGGR